MTSIKQTEIETKCQTSFLNEISCIKTVVFFIQILMKIVLSGPIKSKPVLVQIMIWHRTGDKPCSEPTITYINYWGIYVSLGFGELITTEVTDHGLNTVKCACLVRSHAPSYNQSIIICSPDCGFFAIVEPFFSFTPYCSLVGVLCLLHAQSLS